MEKDRAEKTENRKYMLSQIYFYLTEGCNLSCRHCWLAPRFDPNGNKYPIMPVELFEKVIQEAKPLGLKRVKLSGGEPLLHPHFTRMLEILKQADLAVTIETNGLLCTPDIAAKIARLPKRFVSVSIDGINSDTHDWFRGRQGSFELAQQAVRNLSAANTPPQIIMSLLRFNADQVDEMIRMAERLGASSVKFNIVQPTARGEMLHQTGETLSITELIQLGRHVDMKLAPATRLRLCFDYPLAFRPLNRISNENGGSSCGILGIIGVIASGYYALCGIGEHLQELVFGMAGENPLNEVWMESPTLRSLRNGLPDRLTGVCARCLMKHYCLGDCIAQNYFRTGNLWAPFWFCEQAEKTGLFPNTRLGMAKA